MTNNNKEAEQGTHFVQSNGIRMAYQEFGDADAPTILPVSYTHLTLPTIYSV